MEILIIGIATAFNFIVIKMKFDRGRIADMVVDLICMITLIKFLGGTMTGASIAMVASVLISTYLFYSPPKWPERLRWRRPRK